MSTVNQKKVEPENTGNPDLKEDEEELLPVQPFTFYLKNAQCFKILETRWGIFTIISAIVYVWHFVWAIIGVDKFCDFTRINECGDAKTADEASAIFDLVILLATLFHIIEWVRQTVILTTCLVGVNMVTLYNILSVNVPFGFIVLIIAFIAGFSAPDKCDVAQSERVDFLKMQAISFVLYFPFCFSIYILFKIMGPEWLHEQYLAEDEDDE